MVKKKNKNVKKAMDKLERISLDPREREMYESIQTEEFLQKISENNFKEEGIREGERQTKMEIAKKMLRKNIETREIADITGLTEEEIENIRKEIL